MNIEKIKLSTRATNCLIKSGVTTKEQLLSLSKLIIFKASPLGKECNFNYAK